MQSLNRSCFRFFTSQRFRKDATMNETIDTFCRYLDSERNVSPHTLAGYRSDLEQFRAFVVRERGEGADVGSVDHLLVRRWLAQLHKEYRKSSIGRKLAAVRALFAWLMRTGAVEKNPAELVATPKKEKKLPFHLAIDEVTAELPMLALILQRVATPMPIGWRPRWLTLAGMTRRPRATSSRTSSGSSRSLWATCRISPVIVPWRA